MKDIMNRPGAIQQFPFWDYPALASS